MNIYEKIIEVRKRLPYLQKNSDIRFGNTSYAVVTHDYVTSKLAPILNDLGIMQQVTTTSCEISRAGNVNLAHVSVQVDWFCPDEPGIKVCCTMHSQGMDTQDKAVGKAVSLAVKMAQLKTFMLETGENEEERIDIDRTEGPSHQTQDLISDEEAEKIDGVLWQIGKTDVQFLAGVNKTLGTNYTRIEDIETKNMGLINNWLRVAEKRYQQENGQ